MGRTFLQDWVFQRYSTGTVLSEMGTFVMLPKASTCTVISLKRKLSLIRSRRYPKLGWIGPALPWKVSSTTSFLSTLIPKMAPPGSKTTSSSNLQAPTEMSSKLTCISKLKSMWRITLGCPLRLRSDCFLSKFWHQEQVYRNAWTSPKRRIRTTIRWSLC